jgi:hypothetical protein
MNALIALLTAPEFHQPARVQAQEPTQEGLTCKGDGLQFTLNLQRARADAKLGVGLAVNNRALQEF